MLIHYNHFSIQLQLLNFILILVIIDLILSYNSVTNYRKIKKI